MRALMSDTCPNCNTPLIGEFCHVCGQRRLPGRLTLRVLLDDVGRRIFRLDRMFALTFWHMLRRPGQVVMDHLGGRRRHALDPLHYFISSVFVQFVIAAITRIVAPLAADQTGTEWIGRLGGIVGVKILIIFWMASIWRLLFRQIRWNLAEIYVFAIYAFATITLLWSAVPLVDLLLPVSFGSSPVAVSSVMFAIELAYTAYAVQQFSGLTIGQSATRVGIVLTLGYAVLVGMVGFEGAAVLLLPPMPGA